MAHLLYKTEYALFVFSTLAPSAGRSLPNGRTPSSSSEEEEQSLHKSNDSGSANSEDQKSEVSHR